MAAPMRRSGTTLRCLSIIALLTVAASCRRETSHGPPARPAQRAARAAARALPRPQSPHGHGDATGRVVSVHDGDTITILTPASEQLKVRLHGIDAPELGMPFGRAAKRALSGMVFGRVVTVQGHGTDKYGRHVGEVFLEGTDINRQMIRSGYAWHYRHYDHTRDLQDDEDAARAARLGLWQDPHPEPPWEHRRHGHPRSHATHRGH